MVGKERLHRLSHETWQILMKLTDRKVGFRNDSQVYFAENIMFPPFKKKSAFVGILLLIIAVNTHVH